MPLSAKSPSSTECHPIPSEQGQDSIWHLLLVKLNKERKKSQSSAPKKLFTTLPPRTHRIPRNRMHVPIPAQQPAGELTTRKLNPLRNKEKTVLLPSTTEAQGGINGTGQVPHTLAVPSPQSSQLPNHRNPALLPKLASGAG